MKLINTTVPTQRTANARVARTSSPALQDAPIARENKASGRQPPTVAFMWWGVFSPI
jgi:hypothetical protein